MSKLRAYTVMEMMVVMLISSIVVTMSYTVFSKVVQLNHKVGEIYNKNYNVILFNKLLSADFINSERVVKDPDGFSCHYKDRSVHYVLNEYLSRSQDVAYDTLASVLHAEIAYEYIDKEKRIIKTIVISGECTERPLKMEYRKEYGADLLMKLDEQGN